METKVIAVFDIGKTNKKILLFDQVFNLVYQYEEKFSTTIDEDGFECDDIQLIQNWMVNALSALIEEGKFDIQAINFSTYGASLAFLDKEGKLLTPIYNYLKQVNPDIQESLFQEYDGMDEFCRQTASPALGLLLNSGIQVIWLKTEKKEIWEKVENILHFPQYLSFVLTGQIISEPTSIGCHTFLWDFDKMQYHPWVKKKGVKLPKPVNNDQVYPALIKGKEIKTGVGIHDSSASLVPYLQNSKEDFILVSTGTWCISMNPFNDEPLTSEQLKNDCLCFLTPEKRQVKSSRLFMGHFHETCIAKLNRHFNAGDKDFQNIDYCEDAVNSINLKFGKDLLFFPEGIEKFSEGLEKVDLSVFADYDEAYTRLVIELTQLCVRSIELVISKSDTTKTIYVSGGFSRNKIFVSLLTDYFTDKKVRTSEIDNASALGAALVIAQNIEGFITDEIELESNKNLTILKQTKKMNTCRRIYLPPLSLVGPNALLELKDELAARGFTKALFVTDDVLVKIGVAEKVEDVLKAAGLDYVTYSSVKQNPNTENVKKGLALLTENKCDCIITLGGGSPQDCGKAVGILATNGGSIEDYEGIHVSKKKSLPIIAINTTAGTASEITINYVITDEKRKVKMVMVDKNCLVDIAVNDSMLMLNKPASLTAATGMDALTHAIEAYVTAGAFEWSDTLALKSIELIGSSLRDAVKDGQNIEARTKMAWGQFIAGQAFSNCGLGYVHSMAHQLGGMYDLPHGVCNAILLPYVEEFNAEVCGEKLGKVAEALGADTTGMSVDEKKKAAIDAIKKLSKDVGIPAGLKELNVDPKDFEAMAKNAMVDVCTGGNPREVSLEETIKIYEAAY